MIDAIRRISLATEPLTHFLVARQRRVKELYGRASTVAVTRRIDGRHTSDAEEPLEGPFFVEHVSDTRARSILHVFFQRNQSVPPFAAPPDRP
jgi:hypothetical protein